MKRPDNIDALVRQVAGKMSYRWLPVVRKPDTKTNLGVDISRSFVEEIAFFPFKSWTLAGVFKRKAIQSPGFFTWFYGTLIMLVFLTPWFLLQGVLWQFWRMARSLYKTCTGSLTYMDKTKVLPRND